MEAHVRSCLLGALSPKPQDIAAAEAALTRAANEDAYPVVLARMASSPGEEVPVRQLALMVLKQYIRQHWTALSEQYEEGMHVPSDEAKAHVRHALLPAVSDPGHRVRTAAAHVVSKIAYWDWPERWPSLFDELLGMLKNGDPNAVDGAIRCLSEFTSVITDTQLNVILPRLLPVLHWMVTSPDVFSGRVRCRAISVLRACLQSLYMLSEVHKDMVKSYSSQLAHTWVPAFSALFAQLGPVGTAPASDSDGLLRMELLQALALLVKCFPLAVKELPPALLQSVWASLVGARDIYVRTVVYGDGDDEGTAYDSDGDAVGLAYQVSALFDVVREMSERKALRAMLRGSLDELMYLLVAYMQMTEEQVDLWTSDVNQYAQDTDDADYLSFSVRSASEELLMTLCMSFGHTALRALVGALARHVSEASAAAAQGSAHWWKPHEACMLVVGHLAEELNEASKRRRVQFRLEDYVTAVVMPAAADSKHVFLQGRALWLASRLMEMLPPNVSRTFFEHALAAVGPSASAVVRVDALRALANYVVELDEATLAPHFATLFASLAHIASEATEDLLSLCTETLRMAVGKSARAAADHRDALVPFVMHLWERGRDDMIMSDAVVDIVEELAAERSCRAALLPRFLPVILAVLRDPSSVEPAVPGVAMQLLCALLRQASAPLEEPLIAQAFGQVVQTVLASADDSQIVQTGTACLRYFVLYGAAQLATWSGAAGVPEPTVQSGLQAVMAVIAAQLRAESTGSLETATSNVGELVLAVVQTLGDQLGPMLPELLRACIERLATARLLPLIQSLLLVFARLMLDHMNAVLQFLSSWRVGDQDGLTVLMTRWCDNAADLRSAYATKISGLALLRLYLTRDPRLHAIQVLGDVPVAQGRTTRSKARAAGGADARPLIPLTAKLLKVLVNELGAQLEERHGVDAEGAGEDDDGFEDEEGVDDDEFEDDDEGEDVADFEGGYEAAHGTPFASAEEMNLSDMLGVSEHELNLDDQAHARDPALQADPYWSADLRQELMRFFEAEARESAVVPLMPYLSNLENLRLKLIMSFIVRKQT